MKKEKTEFQIVCEKLDKITELLEHIIAIQLYKGNASQDEIAKNLHMGKTTVNNLVKGLKKQKN
jgi:DNA-binding transcriptional regulator LsrR (DeoR family)